MRWSGALTDRVERGLRFHTPGSLGEEGKAAGGEEIVKEEKLL